MLQNISNQCLCIKMYMCSHECERFRRIWQLQRDDIHRAYWLCQSGGVVMVLCCMSAAKHTECMVCVRTIKMYIGSHECERFRPTWQVQRDGIHGKYRLCQTEVVLRSQLAYILRNIPPCEPKTPCVCAHQRQRSRSLWQVYDKCNETAFMGGVAYARLDVP